jgi:GNAT superfamily N-acetyltransferase
MEYIRVAMIRETPEEIPSYPLPEGYRFRRYRRGESGIWAEIEASVGEFDNQARAREHFQEEFGSFEAEMESRCLFLETATARCIGTATAWYNDDFLGIRYGRLHWVAIHPSFQGKALGKPLVAKALQILRQLHRRAYLTTQTTSYKAINIYLHFGFRPLIREGESLEGWQLLARHLNHSSLSEFRGPVRRGSVRRGNPRRGTAGRRHPSAANPSDEPTTLC